MQNWRQHSSLSVLNKLILSYLRKLMDRESHGAETSNPCRQGSAIDYERGSSINSIKPGNQVEEFCEPTKAKDCDQQSDKQLFMLILKQKKEQQQKLDRQAEAFQARRIQNKKSQIHKLADQQQDLATKQQKQKHQQIMKSIQPSLKKYTLLHKISKDTEVERLRSQGTLSVFTSLMYGTKEASGLGDPDKQDQQIKGLSGHQAYNKCKQIVSEIDSALLKVVNRGNRGFVGKEFKVRWKNLMSNLQDPENYQLRKKVILSVYTPLTLCTIDEIQLYNQRKRQKVKQKRNRILEESIKLQKAPSILADEEQAVPHEEKKTTEVMQKSEKQTSHFSYETLQELQVFLSNQFLKKGKQFLEQALEGREDFKQKIIKHFSQTFPVVQE